MCSLCAHSVLALCSPCALSVLTLYSLSGLPVLSLHFVLFRCSLCEVCPEVCLDLCLDLCPDRCPDLCPEVCLDKGPWTKLLHVKTVSRIVWDLRLSQKQLSEVCPFLFLSI